MLTWIREKFGTGVIGGIIAFIAFVFVFYGIFSPKSTRGLHEGAVAGVVNGDSISIYQFNRELSRRVEFYQKLSGGKLTDEQIKAFRIKDAVFRELANQKLLAQEAVRLGLLASDDEIREKIKEIPVFQKEGRFDLVSYQQTLESNRYTPAAFERMVGEELSVQKWGSFVRKRVHVSERELQQEFQISQDQRNIKYVVLNQETGKKGLVIDPTEVKKFLSDPARLNLAQSKFEAGKKTVYAGQKFEVAQYQVAEDLIAGEKMEIIQKNNEKLADTLLAQRVAQASSRGARSRSAQQQEADFARLLKPSRLQIKATGWITRKTPSIPGVGMAPSLIKDAFAVKAAFDPSQGIQPKKYLVSGSVVLAWVAEVKTPQLADLSGQREKLLAQMTEQKFSREFDVLLKRLIEQGKIESNPAVIGDD
jgi:parvulin-like peptidyl-prolyl isomerase